MTGVSKSLACADLASRCDTLARVMHAVGPLRFSRPDPAGRFGALARMIIYQQLAGGAARAIHGRVVQALGGEVTPEQVLRKRPPTLRRCGLSEAKLRSLRDLAQKARDGEIQVDRIARKSDQQVIEELSRVRGIGEWTAQMFLMFELRRQDVWPVLDLGVRNGYALTYGHDPAPTAKELVPLGERFRPFRSYVACYMWRALDLSRERGGDVGW